MLYRFDKLAINLYLYYFPSKRLLPPRIPRLYLGPPQPKLFLNYPLPPSLRQVLGGVPIQGVDPVPQAVDPVPGQVPDDLVDLDRHMSTARNLPYQSQVDAPRAEIVDTNTTIRSVPTTQSLLPSHSVLGINFLGQVITLYFKF